MTLNNIKEIELNEKESNIINQIERLKNDIDLLCLDLVKSFKCDNMDVETVKDILFYTGMNEIVGRISVNKFIKTIYK